MYLQPLLIHLPLSLSLSHSQTRTNTRTTCRVYLIRGNQFELPALDHAACLGYFEALGYLAAYVSADPTERLAAYRTRITMTNRQAVSAGLTAPSSDRVESLPFPFPSPPSPLWFHILQMCVGVLTRD